MSTVGADDLEPKYLSSKVSTYPAAAVALAAAAFLLTTAAAALDAAAVADAAASATLAVRLTPATVIPVAVSIVTLLIGLLFISNRFCIVLGSPDGLSLYNTLLWNSASICPNAVLKAALLA